MISGDQPGPTILIRADMDALPIQEQNEVDYCSQVPGVMHACGHDGHTAILIGAINVLHKMRSQIKGQVKFLFQPAEEEARVRHGASQPVSAATQVMEAGILNDVDAVLGLHLWPDLPVGTIGIHDSVAMGGSSWFRIILRGQERTCCQTSTGLGYNHRCRNLLNLLQLVVTRNIDPAAPVILNVGTIQGGYRRNVVADRVELTGTVRAIDQYLLDVTFRERIGAALDGLSQALGIKYSFEYYSEVPILKNDPDFVRVIYDGLYQHLKEADGKPKIVNNVTLTGEDFAFYTQKYPGVFLYLGCKDPSQNEVFPLHSPQFNFDEQAIGVGVSALVWSVLTLLEHLASRNSSEIKQKQ